MTFKAYLDTIKEKTGKSPEDFRVIAAQKGLLDPGVKAGEVITWLKDDFGLGRGHAMAIYGTLKSDGKPGESVDEALAKHFAGPRASWRPHFERLLEKVKAFGRDVEVRAGKSYISLLRDERKFGIVQVTAQRFDVGIKLKGVAPSDRFTPAGDWNTMVTHRVRVEDPRQINAELVRWLHDAYEKA